jgi:hypothetical protein
MRMNVKILTPRTFTRSLRPSFRVVAVVGLLAGAALSTGCATSGGNAGPAPTALAITKPSDLLGTKWKLPMTGEGRDGRVIEFKNGPDHRIHAILTKVGAQLDKVVGAYEGADIMELVPDGSPLRYSGTEQIPGKDMVDVHCSISASGEELKCNNENWPWVRVS